jgi:3-dehydrosphinganine reductase
VSEGHYRGKRVVVTGGSSGIGLAMAHRLAQHGAKVRLLARRADRLEAARHEIVQACPNADVAVFQVDVVDGPALGKTLAAIMAEPGGLDVLINNAGATHPGRFVDVPEKTHRELMEVNYFAVIEALRLVVPHMMERRSGQVINVGSLAGVIGIYGYSAYTPSKFALVGLSQVLRAELKPYGIAVSVTHPPETDTPMLAYEKPLLPPATRAIAGTVKALSADAVARAILRGAARGEFEIWCDGGSRGAAFVHLLAPWLMRWFCDSAQKKAEA